MKNDYFHMGILAGVIAVIACFVTHPLASHTVTVFGCLAVLYLVTAVIKKWLRRNR